MRLTLTERTVLDPGYRRACAPARDEAVQTPRLASKKRGEKIRLETRIKHVRGLSEADLIRRMQASGVGRPSTYAATLEALRRHGYIETQQDGVLQVTQRGQQALDFLESRYSFLLDPNFSARIEAGLDALTKGRTGYESLLSELWKTLQGAKS